MTLSRRSQVSQESWKDSTARKNRIEGHKAKWREPGYKPRRYIRTARKNLLEDARPGNLEAIRLLDEALEALDAEAA